MNELSSSSYSSNLPALWRSIIDIELVDYHLYVEVEYKPTSCFMSSLETNLFLPFCQWIIIYIGIDIDK